MSGGSRWVSRWATRATSATVIGAPRRALDRDAPVRHLEVLGRGLEEVGGDADDLVPHAPAAAHRGAPADHGLPRGERAEAEAAWRRCPRGRPTPRRTARPAPTATIWATVVSMPLALRRDPGQHRHRPRRIHPHRRALVAGAKGHARARRGGLTEPGQLVVVREADADVAALAAGGGPARPGTRHSRSPRPPSRSTPDSSGCRGRAGSADGVGQVGGPDQVDAPDLHGIEAERARARGRAPAPSRTWWPAAPRRGTGPPARCWSPPPTTSQR